MSRFTRTATITCLLAAALTLLPGLSGAAGGGPDERTRYEYARNLYMQGASDSAVKELANFVRDYPKGEYSDDAYYLLGKHYMAAGSRTDALDQFKIVLALMPDGDKAPAAQFEIASYWYDPANPDRDLERALAEYLKIPFFYPESPQADNAAYYGALCLFEQHNYPQAHAELGGFVQKYPDSEYAAPAGYLRGLAFLMDGMTAESLAALQSVRDEYPAGLMSAQAMDAAELVIRARDKAQLRFGYNLGEKGDGPGKFSKPAGVAFDPEGFVYVADTGNSRVQRFRYAGGRLELDSASIAPPTLKKEQKLDEPRGVAVGPGGKVYVTDAGLDRVQVFGPDGGLLMTFGKRGETAGDFRGPEGIAVDAGGFIFVADSGNRRVSMFDPSGRYVRSIGVGESGTVGALKSPAGVAIGIKGEIIVTDNSTDSVAAYDRKGTLLGLYGTGKSEVEIKDPSGVCVDQTGNIYVSDPGTGSVVMFDSGLTPLTVYKSDRGESELGRPAGLAVSGPGEVFVADNGNNRVMVLR